MHHIFKILLLCASLAIERSVSSSVTFSTNDLVVLINQTKHFDLLVPWVCKYIHLKSWQCAELLEFHFKQCIAELQWENRVHRGSCGLHIDQPSDDRIAAQPDEGDVQSECDWNSAWSNRPQHQSGAAEFYRVCENLIHTESINNICIICVYAACHIYSFVW